MHAFMSSAAVNRQTCPGVLGKTHDLLTSPDIHLLTHTSSTDHPSFSSANGCSVWRRWLDGGLEDK